MAERKWRIVVAGTLVAVSLLGLIGLLMQMETTSALPPVVPGGAGTRREMLFAPAVGFAIGCSIVVLALVALTVHAVGGTPKRWMWITGSVLAASALAMPFAVAGMQRPAF